MKCNGYHNNLGITKAPNMKSSFYQQITLNTSTQITIKIMHAYVNKYAESLHKK